MKTRGAWFVTGLCLLFCAAFTATRGRQGPSFASGLLEARMPELPVRATGGGEVLLDIEVAPDGRIVDVAILRQTPPFTEAVLSAVRAWRFEPLREQEAEAENEAREPSSEHVLVAALFRAPSFYTGTGAGTPPADVASSSTVVSPIEMVAPPYPARATGDGVVIVELRARDGRPSDSRVLAATPGFESAALGALSSWRFRPQASGRAEARERPDAVVIFGFREPVIVPEP